MQAAPDTVVKITYQLRTEPNGEIMDSADQSHPFSFLFGHNNVLELFEQNLEGKIAGNQFNFVLQPGEGYGEYEQEAVLQLEKQIFSVDGVVQEDMLVVGNVVPLQDQHGQTFQGRIVNLTDTHATVDMNHPFAGKTLYFSGEVLEVRPAHQVEIEHGHVHEHGDHSHH
ncbi:MAG: peptidylprolyl isomerase [Chitinophagales bacterium]|jgi:FKBP-type peptidyl-prolyl cis-trans isomerase SlyD|nr:peptidylprolyl isomerase [Chitinophagales bacterium]